MSFGGELTVQVMLNASTREHTKLFQKRAERAPTESRAVTSRKCASLAVGHFSCSQLLAGFEVCTAQMPIPDPDIHKGSSAFNARSVDAACLGWFGS